MVKKEGEVIEIDSSSPRRPFFCLTSRDQLKETEQKEECFIVECDLGDELSKLNLGASEPDDADDVCVVAEKGQVACRDYPHPRHACAKYPFHKTPHNNHCKLCYCHVCDSAAPCKMWIDDHCHAFDDDFWNSLRTQNKKHVIII